MADTVAARPWPMRGAFIVLALAIIFARLLPLQTLPGAIATPDLLVALIFAWALRRPDYVLALVIAGVMLLADLLLGRPPGLWAALVLIAAEWLKAQGRRPADNTFLAEWLTVATILLAITVAYRIVLGVTIVPPGAISLHVTQFVLTVAVYPLVVAAGWLIFGVRHAAPGDYDSPGRSA
jgi:rod shape-determining protein MreD